MSAIYVAAKVVVCIGAMMWAPCVVGLILGDWDSARAFGFGASVTMFTGLFATSLLRGRGGKGGTTRGEAAGFVVCFWFTAPLAAAVPLWFGGSGGVEGWFGATSALTTTGGFTTAGLRAGYPEGLSYDLWRYGLVWGGGLATAALATSCVLRTGVGGYGALRLGRVGLSEEMTLQERALRAVKWSAPVWVCMTAIGWGLLWLSGGGFWEGLGTSIYALSTAGPDAREWSWATSASAAALMMFGATNWVKLRRGVSGYVRDPELRGWLILFGFTAAALWLGGGGLWVALKGAAGGAGTSGFLTGAASTPWLAPIFLMAALCGGCSLSTGGGFRIWRMMLATARLRREMASLLHPRAAEPSFSGGVETTLEATHGVWVLLSVFSLVLFFGTLGVSSSGPALGEAFAMASAAIANAGPLYEWFGGTSHNVESASVWLCLLMVGGRCEFFFLCAVALGSYDAGRGR